MTDFKNNVIARCKAARACTEQFKRLLVAKTDADFLRVLIDNHYWCVSNDVYTSSELESLPETTLKEAGIATQAWMPLDFSQPVEIAGLLWDPFNVGADADNMYGELMDFETANADRRLPTNKELERLAGTESLFGIYNGVFGRVFDGKIFLPPAGTRYVDGTVYYRGVHGYYWSSTPHSSTNGFHLPFTNVYLYPVGATNYAYGFSVRCVRKNPNNKKQRHE